MFFSREDLAVIVTCITDKGWTLLGLQKNFQARSGITEASIGFLAMIFVFMQDSAPSHRAKATQDFFETTRPIYQLTRMDCGHRIRQI